MANLIILEGLSRTGKSSIAEMLSSKYGFRQMSVKDKMPECIENLHEFYHGIHVMANMMYSAFPEETFVLDRSFISELVYSKFFNRSSLINESDSLTDLLLDNNFAIVYLSNTYEKYLERNPKDRIIYSKNDFIVQKDSFDWYFDYYKNNSDSGKWKNRFIEIDTSINSIDESISEIEKLLIKNSIIENAK